jgi:secreted trypsin-like serine protease
MLVAALAAVALAAPAQGAGPKPLIIGGRTAPEGAYPWMSALVFANDASNFRGQFCGGTLISPTRVLTAAHCTPGESPLDIDVVVGAYRLRANDGTRVDVSGIAENPQFQPRGFALLNDAAIIELETPVSTPSVGLIDSSSASLAAPGATARVIGWGTQTEGEPDFPNVLREADLQIKPDQDCANVYRTYQPAVQLCAQAPRRDTCQGDSGGPLLVADGGGGWLQAGITSSGRGCARPGIPGMYSEVLALRDFILDPSPVFKPYTTGKPRISGTERVGGRLHCTPAPVVGTEQGRAFAWLRREPARGGGVREVVIPGANSADYRPQNRDRGRRVACAFAVGNQGGVDIEQSRFVRIAR